MAKYCSKCGKEIDDNASFCQYCGQNSVPTPNQGNKKSKIAAGILGICLGYFGVHNFYLGFTGKAVGQLLITLISCGTLFWISWIWGLIEGILILTGSINKDANGNELID